MKLHALAVLSVLIVIAFLYTKVLNVQNMIATGDNGSSYADISAIIYILGGIGLTYISWRTFKTRLHPAAIVLYGSGISILLYGLFLCSVKGII